MCDLGKNPKYIQQFSNASSLKCLCNTAKITRVEFTLYKRQFGLNSDNWFFDNVSFLDYDNSKNETFYYGDGDWLIINKKSKKNNIPH